MKDKDGMQKLRDRPIFKDGEHIDGAYAARDWIAAGLDCCRYDQVFRYLGPATKEQ